ncbi:ATP-binding protein [Motilimonas pumila]|uniref:histidine kinase n=1 Tax=Motilimonas pumila TaxID=2303987 RepID=A0A418YFV4_9GAMM|nr:ATP-binding protein [Motilimonas pumila]RJG48424.1 HAMP domain-containing protein [Motilimonas pumila]
MSRFFIESFIGLLLFFAASVVAYESLIFGHQDNYDQQVINAETQATLKLFNHLAAHLPTSQVELLLQDYCKQRGTQLSRFSALDYPDFAPITYFELQQAKYYIADLDNFWFVLDHSEAFYYVSFDEQALLYQQLHDAEDLLWLFWLMGFAAYCLLLAWFLNRRYRALAKASAAFGNGDFSARVSESSHLRLGSLNRSFNAMADKISALINNNKQLTHALAHDLRTPIFRIQWQADILSVQTQSEITKQTLNSIIEDTEELSQMVDEMLYYSKLEREDLTLTYQSILLEPWLGSLLANLQATDAVTLKYHLPDNLKAEFDPRLIKRALNNLLSNAIKYCQHQAVLEVKIMAQNVDFWVYDDGPGIDAEHFTHLFKPFYRVDSDRNKTTGGYGLGLAIVKQIACRHQGSVGVQQGPLGGVSFCLSIPLKAAH